MAIVATARLKFKNPDIEAPGAFGYGIALLLAGVQEEHSLNRAAKRMGMAYSKAWRIVREAEAQLGYDLLERDGARGSTLTDKGERALEVFWSIQHDVDEILAQRVHELEDL